MEKENKKSCGVKDTITEWHRLLAKLDGEHDLLRDMLIANGRDAFTHRQIQEFCDNLDF